MILRQWSRVYLIFLMALNKKMLTCFKNLSKLIDADIVFFGSNTIEDFSNFGDALVFKGFERDDFRRGPEIFMVRVMIFDALCTEGLYTCHGSAEVDERLAIVFDTAVINKFC